MYVLYQVLSILSNVWLLKWSTAENPSDTNATQSQTASNNYFYFEVYLALGVAEGTQLRMTHISHLLQKQISYAILFLYSFSDTDWKLNLV